MKRNVTMIDELPELEDDGNSNMPIIRGIKPSMTPQQMQQQYMFSPERQVRMNHTSMMGDDRPVAPVERSPPHMGFMKQDEEQHRFNYDKKKICCIEIAEHIQSCPICSRFYNVDKTPYILAIVILSIVCIILLKRVLSI